MGNRTNKFIEEVTKVLNSNTVFVSVNYTGEPENILPFIEDYIKSGELYLAETEELEVEEGMPITIPNLELNLIEISLPEFKSILLDMLLAKNVYFPHSPYGVEQDEGYAKSLVDKLIRHQTKSEEPTDWTFYNMPRYYQYTTKEERLFLDDKTTNNYRPMSKVNDKNYLGSYFCHLGLDSFLIFHSNNKICFLLTNGGD